MTKKIKCDSRQESSAVRVNVRILKAPFVDTLELKKILYARAKALVI